MKKIGHKGADLIEPGNTRASFEAALAHGVDMIEFDVLPERRDDTGGRLVLAHDFEDAAARDPLTLEQGLDLFASEAFASVELDVDLKLPGYEERVIDALRERSLHTRTLISTMEPVSLARIRALAPEIRLGWSVPKVRRDYLANPLTKPLALAVLVYARRSIPRRLVKALRAGEVDAVMAHWALVTPAFARAILDAGGDLYVWTVDEQPRIETLTRLGVTGIISNDPRLFAAGAG